MSFQKEPDRVYGTLWRLMEPYGAVWIPMEPYGTDFHGAPRGFCCDVCVRGTRGTSFMELIAKALAKRAWSKLKLQI